jgi:hypothetical protein
VVNLGDVLYPLIDPSIWPSDSQLPAAGVCAEPSSGSLVRIDLEQGTPAPRCVRVLNHQRLQFSNKTDQTVDVQLGDFYQTLDPGATSNRFDQLPVSAYLAPGVHVVHTSAYAGSGPEIWLIEPAPSTKP